MASENSTRWAPPSPIDEGALPLSVGSMHEPKHSDASHHSAPSVTSAKSTPSHFQNPRNSKPPKTITNEISNKYKKSWINKLDVLTPDIRVIYQRCL
jgi:hypothetical protein